MIPPSTTSSLSGGEGNTGRQLFNNNKAMDVKSQVFCSGFQVVVLKACREELTG